MLLLRKKMIDRTYSDVMENCENYTILWEKPLLGLPMGLAPVTGQAVMNIIGSGSEKHLKRVAKFLSPSIWYTVKR